MEHPEITCLYKYRVFNTHSLSMLINRKVWFAKPNSLNDPFDCKIPFDHRLTTEEVVTYYRKIDVSEEKINAILNSKGEIQKGFTEVLRKILKDSNEELEKKGVFSLSESSNNILLWSHYTDGHRGFCVEFARNPDNLLGDYETTRRVQYRNDYPIINPTKEDVFDLKFFTKGLDWAYEKEWRLINEEGDVEESLPGVDISAIIFGHNMDKSHKEIIRKITSGIANIKYRQAIKVPDRLELGIEDV